MPSLLPHVVALPTSVDTTLGVAVKLVYIDLDIRIYYSFQHPIAFLSRKVYLIRRSFWTNFRLGRAEHLTVIDSDIRKELAVRRNLPTPENLEIVTADDETFFSAIKLEMGTTAIENTSNNGVLPGQEPSIKRRVIL